MVRRKLLSQLAWLPFVAVGAAQAQEPPKGAKKTEDHDEECLGIG